MGDQSVNHGRYLDLDLAVPNVILMATDLEGDIDYLLPHAVVDRFQRVLI
jgi:hypothetical protein